MHSQRHSGSVLVTLVVLVSLGAFFTAFLIPAIHRGNATSDRVKCANNLKQIGLAISLYADENRGEYPRTVYQEADKVIPDISNGGFNSSDPFARDTTVPVNCVAASYFLLARTEHIGVRVFLCPSTATTADDFGGGTNTSLNRGNFTSIKDNLSYAFANPFPDRAAHNDGYRLTNMLDAGFAVAADRGPGIAQPGNLLAVTMDMPNSQQRLLNSRNHGQDGQNVLYADGHVDFDNTVFCGLNRDNIYLRGAGGPGSSKDDLVNSPKDKNDSVLLPDEPD